MSLLTQIKERLRSYANEKGAKSLSTARVEEIAAILDGEVTEEDKIDAEIERYNKYRPLADIAKADDNARAAEAFKKKQQPANPATPAKEEDNENPDSKTDPVLAAIQALQGEIASLKTEKVVNSRKSQLTETLKDAPEAYRNKQLKAFERMTFASDEDFTSFLEEEKTDYAAFAQSQDNSKLGKDRPNGGVGGGKGGATSEATKAELDSAIENFKI